MNKLQSLHASHGMKENVIFKYNSTIEQLQSQSSLTVNKYIVRFTAVQYEICSLANI